MGIAAERLRLRPHDADELSHYSKQTTDVEYDFPMGWSELEGVADRTDYDLRAHAAGSGKTLAIFDEASGEHVTPFVIEPAMGVDRAVLTVLLDGYTEEQLGGEKRTVLRIRPSLAPIKAAVLPLLRNARSWSSAPAPDRRPEGAALAATYDDTASIGKPYRRQDEIGTPFCVTVDVDTLDDGAATIRERDSMTQERVALAAIPDRLAALIAGTTAWEGVPRQAAPADDERDQRLASAIPAWPGCWPHTTPPSRRTGRRRCGALRRGRATAVAGGGRHRGTGGHPPGLHLRSWISSTPSPGSRATRSPRCTATRPSCWDGSSSGARCGTPASSSACRVAWSWSAGERPMAPGASRTP